MTRPSRLPRLLLLALAAFGLAVAVPAAAQANFTACVDGLARTAQGQGVPASVTNRALQINAPDDKVLRLSRLQPEFKTPIWDYMTFLVDPERIKTGQKMMRKHRRVLDRVEAQYGVDKHVVAAIWGVETDFGAETGDNFLPHALATLACAGDRRRDFWKGELMSALKLVARGDLRLEDLYGSWAGAFGQTQFIPSSYARLAVDGDGDGRRDLVNSVPDALASTANYLKRSGWTKDASWLIEVKAPANYSGPTGRKNRATLSTWGSRGITRADGRPLAGGARGGLLLPAGPRGPGFLVFPNFNAIYSYNLAESYALAISHLADRMAGYPGLRTAWPTDDPGLTRKQRLDLQKRLLRAGYDIGKADGKIGPITRAAIKQVEAKAGMPQTGRAGMKVYRALGGRG